MSQSKKSRMSLKIPVPAGTGANNAAANIKRAKAHWQAPQIPGRQSVNPLTILRHRMSDVRGFGAKSMQGEWREKQRKHYKKGKSLQHRRVSQTVIKARAARGDHPR